MALPYRVVCVQFTSILAIAAALLAASVETAVGAVWTGVACVLPNLYFAWRVEQTRNASAAGRLLFGSIARFATTGALLAVVLVLLEPPAAGFVAGLVTAQLAQVGAAVALR